MRLRIPLAFKALFWLLANLLLVALLASIFAKDQLRAGFDGLLSGSATQRIHATAEIIAAELRDLKPDLWNTVLERHAAAHHLQFALFRPDAVQAAGPTLEPPQKITDSLRQNRLPSGPELPPSPVFPPPPQRPELPPGIEPPRHFPRNLPQENRPADSRIAPEPRPGFRNPRTPPIPPPRILFFLRAGQPARYWMGIRIALWHGPGSEPRPYTLLLASDTLTGHGLFLDPLPWAGFAAAALGVSALVWLPIVGGITRAVRKVNDAARRIAKGGFDTRIPENRRDELGELAGSVNTMAQQLGDYVSRQRRLTADVAHELCSPIARMQRALALVEQRAAEDQKSYIQKLDHELQHMARLVEEVLSFSRSESGPKAEPEPVNLAELASETAAAEAPDSGVEIAIPTGLVLTVLRAPLERALANVIRNAVRYAGAARPIRIDTQTGPGNTLDLLITDSGPGVPPETLSKIFEPFYRPEAARQRSTGGTGLGLAIVQSCIQSCGGSVSASLPAEGGLQIRFRLPNHS
jgi:two-component system sensor histidine kinase CpxA